MKRINILTYVEDPGAANYLAPLPAAAAKRGWQCLLVAEGAACEQLRRLDIPFSPTKTIDTNKFDIFVTGTSENPDTKSFAWINRCRRDGIPSLGVVDAPQDTQYRFRGNNSDPLTHAPDWIAVSEQSIADAFQSFGFAANRLVVCGNPHFDRIRTVAADRKDRKSIRRKFFPDATPDQSIIVFLAETSDGLEQSDYRRSSDYTLTGRGGSDCRTNIVLEEFLDAIAALPISPYVVLRLHPKNKKDEFSQYEKEIDALNSEGLSMDLIMSADLIVGMSTSLLLEAALIGVPVLSILPRPSEKSRLPSILFKAIPCISQSEELVPALSSLLNQACPINKKILDQAFPVNAINRFTDLIERIVRVHSDA